MSRLDQPLPVIPRLIFADRWLQLPLYLGLILAQAVYVHPFWMELIHLIGAAPVDGASFELPTGAVGLLGRNGACKTSILRALLGLVRPCAGQMRVLDLPAGTDPREVRRRVGYLPERDCFIPGLNGFETVALAGQHSAPALPRVALGQEDRDPGREAQS